MSDSPSHLERWFLLGGGNRAPAENMAWDEALLEQARSFGSPIARFYGWNIPAATFGYFQPYEDVARMTPLRPLIRRPTAGGLVLHDGDWTYSVVIPPGHSWYGLKAVESYQRVHEWIQAAFATLGISTELSPCRLPDGPGQCFVGAEQYDLLFRGRKIAGAAQRRRKDGLLIQGSIQPVGLTVERAAFERAFCDVAIARWNYEWAVPTLPPLFAERVAELREAKYGSDAYNREKRGAGSVR